MTVTPNRNRHKAGPHASGANPASPADTGVSTGAIPSTLSEQLKSAGLDLTGHKLAEVFNALDPVPIVDTDDADDAPAADCTETVSGAVPASGAVPETDDDNATGGAPADTDSPEADSEAADHRSSPHPLLTNEIWNDLAKFAPEVTDSITALMSLDEELRTFDRPMGPTQALHLIDGAEAVTRVSEALSTLALSVYERVGTPTDSGAKDTQSLIQSRLNLTRREAKRRASLAKNLGGRVTTEGQALPPLCPVVADKLHDGSLSSGQVAVIEECLSKLPEWVDPDVRTKVESDLVGYAPTVAVNDLRDIFRRALAHIDPDGAAPKDPNDRTMYFVNARPKQNGDWKIEGLLDPAAGSELHGLLTSRIESADELTAGVSGISRNDKDAAFTPNAGSIHAPGQEQFEIFDSVLTGDRLDAPSWAVVDATKSPITDTQIAAGHGIREDGSTVNLISEQPTARNWIYERFATLISRISMKEAEKGSPYALVITAKAEDLANNTGEGTTGAGDRIPIEELTNRGLNGRVFFHLMDKKARTVDVKTENRFANKKQVAIITARDRGCTFPGCDSPPGWCDVNHVVPHSQGGKTDINNMSLACSAHHHLLDRSDWEMRMLVDGRPAWVPPASIDPARRPILHSRFLAQDIIETLFDE